MPKRLSNLRFSRYYPILLDSGMRCQITTRWHLYRASCLAYISVKFLVRAFVYKCRAKYIDLEGKIVVGKHRYKKHVFSFRNCISFNDLLCIYLFIRRSNMYIVIYSSIHLHLSFLYYKPIQWPAPSLLANSIPLREKLHRYRRAQG